MLKALAILSACLLSSSALARLCEEDPVAMGHAKFEEQLKKAAYELVLVAEAKKVAPTDRKDMEAEFESRGVLYSLGDIRPFVPKNPNEPVIVKVQKKKGSVAMENGKLYSLYLKKDKDTWMIGPCSHSHEAKGFMVADVQAEQTAILKAFGVNIQKTLAPATPAADKKFKEHPPLKPVAPGAPPVSGK